jgi:hypothetical protein
MHPEFCSGKRGGKILLKIRSRRWEDTIKVDIKKVVIAWIKFIKLDQWCVMANVRVNF